MKNFLLYEFCISLNKKNVHPSAPQPEGWGLPSARSQADGSGLTLSGAFFPDLKGGDWRRRSL